MPRMVRKTSANKSRRLRRKRITTTRLVREHLRQSGEHRQVVGRPTATLEYHLSWHVFNRHVEVSRPLLPSGRVAAPVRSLLESSPKEDI